MILDKKRLIIDYGALPHTLPGAAAPDRAWGGAQPPFNAAPLRGLLEHCLNEIGQCSNAIFAGNTSMKISQGKFILPSRDILNAKMP